MGKNDADMRMSVRVFKHLEIDRLTVSPKCPSPLPNPNTEEEEAKPHMMVRFFHTWLVQ